jgi:hypothetical protein
MTDGPLVKNGWVVGGIRQASEFFDALVELLPWPTCLCFEGTSIASDIRALLVANAVAPTMNIATGTIRPKPSVFHVLANEILLRRIAMLARHHAESEICDHFHVYQNDHGLLMWYDAFDDPLIIDESISEAAVEAFCSRLGVSYSRQHAS